MPKFASLSADKNGDVWLSSSNVIYHCDVTNKEIYVIRHDSDNPVSCPEGYISDIYFDSKNNLWATVLGKGISVLRQTRNPFQVFSEHFILLNTLLDSTTFLFQIEDKNEFQTLDMLTGKVGVFSIPNNIFPEKFNFIKKTTQGDIIANGSYEKKWATYIWNSQTNERSILPRKGTPLKTSTQTILENSFHQIYDVYKLLESKGRSDALTSNNHNVVIDKKGRIWAGTDGAGLILYDTKSDAAEIFQHDTSDSKSIASDVMYNVFQLSDGRIALGTIRGLSIMDTEKKVFQNISESDGLAHNQIRSITQDLKGNIWVANPSTIACISSDGKNIRNYTTADGLPPGKLTGFIHCDTQGQIYFGVDSRIIRFHPDSLIANPTPPAIQLLDFFIKKERITPLDSSEILGQSLRFLEELDLNYQQSDFGFSFIMPDLHSEKQA